MYKKDEGRGVFVFFSTYEEKISTARNPLLHINKVQIASTSASPKTFRRTLVFVLVTFRTVQMC